MWGNRLIAKNEVHNATEAAPIVGAAVWGDHICIYRLTTQLKGCLRRMVPQSRTVTTAEWRLKALHAEEEQAAPETTWFRLTDEIRPGHYKVDEESMSDLRERFLREGRSPIVTLRGPHDIAKLTYNFSSLDAHTGTASFQSWSKSWPDNRRFVDTLNANHPSLRLQYAGESTATVTSKAIFALLRGQRERLSPSETEDLFKRQGGKCLICREEPATEVDHIIPFCSGGKHEPSNLRGVCAYCHRLKSTAEQQRTAVLGINPLESRFSKKVWEAVVHTTPAIIGRMH